jgi:hypothetical protein
MKRQSCSKGKKNRGTRFLAGAWNLQTTEVSEKLLAARRTEGL